MFNNLTDDPYLTRYPEEDKEYFNQLRAMVNNITDKNVSDQDLKNILSSFVVPVRLVNSNGEVFPLTVNALADVGAMLVRNVVSEELLNSSKFSNFFMNSNAVYAKPSSLEFVNGDKAEANKGVKFALEFTGNNNKTWITPDHEWIVVKNMGTNTPIVLSVYFILVHLQEKFLEVVHRAFDLTNNALRQAKTILKKVPDRENENNKINSFREIIDLTVDDTPLIENISNDNAILLETVENNETINVNTTVTDHTIANNLIVKDSLLYAAHPDNNICSLHLGQGVFTKVFIKKDSHIINFNGVLKTREEYEEAKAMGLHYYTVEWPGQGDLYLDCYQTALNGQDIAAKINSQYRAGEFGKKYRTIRAKCRIGHYWDKVSKEWKVSVIANRNIKPNEELTLSYSSNFDMVGAVANLMLTMPTNVENDFDLC